ncbi:hypothetical protein D0962_24555 [Leptolyngbyaceae cyanobacterium CCMR0082]|uniref:Uncharacterized protein n=1 Tax=Adonisia turfae CCMR0082 TaxID=2304604 RepID=A0A6M0SCW2_9CYAN|nr:hypothetical protein [Adonisia turfae]MDV3352729.1 hypothetical protein [Leptothoe sp. LEGE 181152]NEZ65893.1 hypothetical protein [Adonisia turfae CCMR0082]
MTQKQWLKLGLAALLVSAVTPSLINHLATPITAETLIAETLISETIINYSSTSRTDERDHSDEDNHHDRAAREVTVEIVAQGDEWADVYIDNRRLFSPRTLNRSKKFQFEAGIYDIRVHSATNYFDRWVDGSLEISDANGASSTVVLRFSETGRVRVSGRYHTWISNLD